jgi:hypothetical protein
MKRRKRWWIVGGRVGRAVSGCAGVGVGVVDVDVVRRGRQHVHLVRRRQTTWETILQWIMVAYDVDAETLGWEVSKDLKT